MSASAKTKLPPRNPAGPCRHPALAVRRDLGGAVPHPGLRLRQLAQAEKRFKNEEPGYQYSRFSNPDRRMFEQRMAAFEGAEAARATATGMAAVTTALIGQVKAGDHVVAAKALFGSCRYVVEDYLPRYGVASTLVDGTDLEPGATRCGRTPRPSFWKPRPTRRSTCIDIAAVAEIAHAAGATLVVDNVFATPLLQNPLAARRRLRRLFGDQAHRRPGPLPRRRHPGSEKFIKDNVQTLIRQTGPSLSPFNAWVLLKGLETLPCACAGRPTPRQRSRSRWPSTPRSAA